MFKALFFLMLFPFSVASCFATKSYFNSVGALKLKNESFKDFSLEKKTGRSDQENFLFKKNAEKLYVEVSFLGSETAAQTSMSEGMQELVLKYRENVSPYPGVISKTITCADEYKPKKIEVSARVAYELYANDRFSFGICSPDQIEFRASVFYLTCGSRFYRLKYFYSKSAQLAPTSKILSEFRCET